MKKKKREKKEKKKEKEKRNWKESPRKITSMVTNLPSLTVLKARAF